MSGCHLLGIEIMPAYDYKCQVCGKIKEFILPMNHETPQCCGQPMERVFSEMKFILKGEGWSLQGYEKPNEMMERETTANRH